MSTMQVNPEFWSTLTDEEFNGIVDRNGVLDGDLLKRIWAMSQWPGKPPESIQLLFKRSDIEREFP